MTVMSIIHSRVSVQYNFSMSISKL